MVKTGNVLIHIAFDNVAIVDRGLQSQENNRRRSGKKSRWELYCRTVRMGGVVVGGGRVGPSTASEPPTSTRRRLQITGSRRPTPSAEPPPSSPPIPDPWWSIGWLAILGVGDLRRQRCDKFWMFWFLFLGCCATAQKWERVRCAVSNKQERTNNEQDSELD